MANGTPRYALAYAVDPAWFAGTAVVPIITPDAMVTLGPATAPGKAKAWRKKVDERRIWVSDKWLLTPMIN